MPSRAAALPGSSDAASQSVAARRASLVSCSLSGMRYGASMVRVRFSAAFGLPRIAIPSTLKRARPHGPYDFFHRKIAAWPLQAGAGPARSDHRATGALAGRASKMFLRAQGELHHAFEQVLRGQSGEIVQHQLLGIEPHEVAKLQRFGAGRIDEVP